MADLPQRDYLITQINTAGTNESATYQINGIIFSSHACRMPLVQSRRPIKCRNSLFWYRKIADDSNTIVHGKGLMQYRTIYTAYDKLFYFCMFVYSNLHIQIIFIKCFYPFTIEK